MFMNRKYCQNVSSSQVELQIQHNPNQNQQVTLSMSQTGSKAYTGRQKTEKPIQYFLAFNWKITALQCCVGFCHTTK